MITNGKIRTINTTGSESFDEDGFPLPLGEVYSDYIECNIRHNTRSDKGRYEDGRFTVASYEVLVEEQPLEAQRIEITDNAGAVLGVFKVQLIEHMRVVGRIKIQV